MNRIAFTSLVVLGLTLVAAQDCSINPSLQCPSNCTDINDHFCADDKNCRKYLECEADGVYECTCPPGQLFDVRGPYCDYEDRVECGSRLVCDDNDQNCEEHHVTTRPPCPGGQCSLMCTGDMLDGRYEYAPCDNRYCHCVFVNMDACIETCQVGTIFDPQLGGCNFQCAIPDCYDPDLCK